MHDPDEIEALEKRYAEVMATANTPEVRARMIADGIDPDAKFKEIEAAFQKHLTAKAAAEAAEENALQATADVGDATYELFKSLRTAIREHKKANPLDPRVEEWEEIIEALSEQYPKETD